MPHFDTIQRAFGVLAGVKDLEIAKRSPTTTMVLPTGLTYESVVSNAGLFQEYGVLGNVVISITPKPQDINAGKIVLWVRSWLKETYNVWEPMQMDPRHIGTHDGYNMGTVNHYHLIAPGGVTATQKEAIISKMAEYDEAEQAKENEEKAKKEKARQAEQEKQAPMSPEEQVMRAFMKAEGVSKSDKGKQVLLRTALGTSVQKALQKWKTIQGGLDWKP